MQAFEDKVRCFVDQYHEFTVPGLDGKPLHVNGRLTLGENIADAGGLSASFQAWKRREAQEPTQRLPGLQHFSKEQLFFISYSNWWCGKTRKETAVDSIYRDPHSPKWARILVREILIHSGAECTAWAAAKWKHANRAPWQIRESFGRASAAR